ncbi:MAG: sensor histidine kinase [Bacteroidetes bacterium]|nr:MAG: sensor histidine kinase [Bacteroidota bacterium]
MITQIYWLRQVLTEKQAEFDQRVRIALRKVAEKNADYGKMSLPTFDVVAKISSNYYAVNVNSAIDANILEYYLKSIFTENNLHIDFEYGIYDCATDDIVYGDYVNSDSTQKKTAEMSTKLPKWNGSDYYFAVRFPSRGSYLADQMGIWIASLALLLIVIVFFAYTIFVIFKQKRLSEIQKDFINNMTHEFKTPISTIAIASEVLSKPDIIQKPERLLNYAIIIQKENNRLKSQVEKVLQMTQIEQEVLKLKLEKANLHDLIRKTVHHFDLKIEESQGKIRQELLANDPEILADHLHLGNILYNLLDNSIKYSGENPPDILVKTEHLQIKKRTFLSILILDKGIGISKEHQKQVFDKFFRVPTGNLHNVKGFGLGLNYVQTIVKVHKWQIKIESELGKGCTIRLLI